MTRFSLGRHAIFRTISQIRIHYPDSALSLGAAGDVRGGDRLPWTGATPHDNFEPLRSLDWQAHVYGEAQRDIEAECRALNLPLYSFQWNESMEETGLKRDSLYLVRPDGYIALASSEQDANTLRASVERFHLRFQTSSIVA